VDNFAFIMEAELDAEHQNVKEVPQELLNTVLTIVRFLILYLVSNIFVERPYFLRLLYKI
jgi:hypothetical protein